jgi:hypothetical protein
MASKAWSIITNPMTALAYKVQGRDIPDYLERGKKNSLDLAANIVNPFFYINELKEFGKGVGNIAYKGVTDPFSLSGMDFLNTAMHGLGALPAAAEAVQGASLLSKGFRGATTAYKGTAGMSSNLGRIKNAANAGALELSGSRPGDIYGHSYFNMPADEVSKMMSQEIASLPKGAFSFDGSMSKNSAPLFWTQAARDQKAFTVVNPGTTQGLNWSGNMGKRVTNALPKNIENIMPNAANYAEELKSRVDFLKTLGDPQSLQKAAQLEKNGITSQIISDLPSAAQTDYNVKNSFKEFLNNYKPVLDKPIIQVNRNTGLNFPMTKILDENIGNNAWAPFYEQPGIFMVKGNPLSRVPNVIGDHIKKRFNAFYGGNYRYENPRLNHIRANSIYNSPNYIGNQNDYEMGGSYDEYGQPCYECGGMYADGGYYDCPDQEKDPVTGKCKAEEVRGKQANAANKAATTDMNAWAKQVAAMDKEIAKQNAAQLAGQLSFDYDWMGSPVDKAEKKAAVGQYKQFFQQNPNTFIADDTSGYSPEQKYIIASKLKQRMSTPMGAKLVQQQFGVDPRFYDLQRLQTEMAPKMGGWNGMRNWLFNVFKEEGGPIVDPLPAASGVQQLFGNTPAPINPTIPYTTSKDPADFYKSWIQSPEYARRQLNTGYSASPKDESYNVPSASASRKTRLESLGKIDPITYNTREASKATPGYYGGASSVNINSSDYIDTNRQMIEAHELAHIAGAAVNEGTSRPGIMSGREQDIFKSSMLPLREPTLSGPQGSPQREASRRSLEDFIHSQKPQEVKADLDALRFSMYDKGIYDIRKGTKFNDLDFENARQKLGKDRVFKRLENRVGKKNFVNLMNTIAQDDNQDSYSNTAAYGGPIVDPRGQWAHPGKVTRIPSSNITMQGVPYPVYGVGSNGQEQMMQPGQNYDFGGASYVDEYPMMQFGGGTLLGPSPMIMSLASKVANYFSKPNTSASTPTKNISSKELFGVTTYDEMASNYYDKNEAFFNKRETNDQKKYDNSSNSINLTSGRFRGAKVAPGMINDIVNAAKANNVDPWVMLSLVGRESTFGSGEYNNYRANDKQNLVSGWNVAEDYEPYKLDRYLADKKVPGVKVVKDSHGWNYKVEDEKAIENYLKSNPQLVTDYYKKLESTPDLGKLDSFSLAAQRIKKKGIQNYNPGDPRYSSMVNSDMNLLKNDAALKTYMKTLGYREGGEFGKMQVGGQNNNLLKNIKGESEKFLKGWMDSPMYKKMINASINTSPRPDAETVKAINREDQLKKMSWDYSDLDADKSWFNKLQGTTLGEFDPLNNKVLINPTVNDNRLYAAGIHEASHATDRAGAYIPISDITKMINYKKENEQEKGFFTKLFDDYYFNDYVGKPTETRARLNSVRYIGKQEKLYDPYKEKIDKNILKKFSNTTQLDQLRKIYNDEQIIDMLNSVSQSKKQPEDFIPQAKNGGGLLSKTVSCSNCGWSWKAVDGGSDPLSCHKCGGTVKMQAGGQPNYNSILDQNAADAEKYPSAYHKDFVTGYPVVNSAGSIPRPGGFDCPPGYTKYRNPDGTFSCIMTNSAPGSSKVDFSRMTKVADDMQFSRPMRPPLASIPTRKNGGLINMQGGGQSSMDSVRHQANKILQYEQLKGGPGGAPLPKYSNPKYMDILMGKVYPEVRKIMPNASAMEAGEAMDFVFNAGFDKGSNKITKDPRAFALQEYYRQYDKSKLDADGKWAGRKNAPYSFDQEYNNTIGKLPENQRRILMNKGRDWYYKNINNPAPGVPNSNYNDTWYGRIWNTNDYQPFNPNNPNFTPKKEQGGEASLWDLIKMAQGGEMIRRADGSYSRRGLWDNIRANKGSGKKPTKQMIQQERIIKAKNK